MGSVHRPMRILSTALLTAGIVVLADVVLTLVWKEPVSAAYGTFQQGQAEDELAELEGGFDTSGAPTEAIARARFLGERFERQIREGDAIGRVQINAIGVDMVMLNGTDTATLQKGPGRYLETPLPGMGKTTGIAGHRTTYLAPFSRINEIEKGDEIRVELPYAGFTYEVEKHEIVDPGDVEILDPVGYDRVVLTACHPRYSAAQRYVVFGKLTRIDTFAAGGEGAWPPL